MVNIPPGFVYLFDTLPNVLSPPVLLYLALKAAGTVTTLDDIPRWAIFALYVLSVPLGLFVRITFTDYEDANEAASYGAVLPPRVPDKWPGDLGVLVYMMKTFNSAYPGDMFLAWANVHGNTFNFRTLFENRFFTCEPEYIKAILATQFDSFEKGTLIHDTMATVLGTGVFNSDGEMWKFHRSITRPFFSKDRITDFDTFDRHAADAFSQLKARLKEGHPVDIQDLASRFTMDSATEFLFGNDVRSLEAGLPYPYYTPEAASSTAFDHPANKFARSFEQAQRLTALRVRRGAAWPVAEFWKNEITEHMDVIYSFISPILAAALERKRAESRKEAEVLKASAEREIKEGETLLDHLLNYTRDQTVLRDEILNILLAGRDTTTNTITFAVYMLAEHPEVLKKLRAEILATVGPLRRPAHEDMRNMKYLRAVINETLRLYPAVPFNVRTTSKPVVLPPTKDGAKPFYLPAGSRVPYSIFLMQRREDLWGPDAQEFDPERFLDDRNHKYVTSNPFIFLPFNAGPRICLGQQFAYHETSFFLIRLLQQFSSITHVFDAQPPSSRPLPEWKNGLGTKGRDKIRMQTYMTMSVMGGCWVRMEEAEH